MVRGSCPVLSLFLGCLSGSSELDWCSVSSRCTECVFLILKALFILASASAGRIGCSMLCLLVALFPGAGVGCPLLSSRALWRSLRPLPCSSVCGLHCIGPTSARHSQWETYILCGRSGVTWSAWAAHRQRCERFLFAAGCSMKELSKTTVSWLWMPLSRVCRLSVTERSVLCLLSSVRSCCRSVSSLRRTLLSSWWEGVDVAFTLILARLLRGRCPSVPRSLPQVLCGGSAGPGFARACSPRHITAYNLETGPWAMFPRSFSYHPLSSHGMSRLVVRVCLHILKCCLYYFLEILDCIFSESLVPS